VDLALDDRKERKERKERRGARRCAVLEHLLGARYRQLLFAIVALFAVQAPGTVR
jgi:hypothetical protein